MAWKEISNDIVLTWQGRPRKHQRLTNDSEGLWREFNCPAEGCDQMFSLASDYRNHWRDNHEGQPQNVPLEAIRDETRVSDIVFGLCMGLGDNSPQSIFHTIRKPADGMHATELWRRVHIAVEQGKAIRVKPEQYDWLHQLLDRKLAFTKAQREAGEEQQTIGTVLYGLDLHNVKQALTILSERAKVSAEDEATAEAAGGA